MTGQDLVLNIAVNLGRLSRWSSAGRTEHIKQFLTETEQYLTLLESVQVSEKFKPTLKRFRQELAFLKKETIFTYDWAERALTWANILQHRASLV